MPPRVTVLLPVYQGALYLAEAVDSILAQSWRDLELRIVDDGSSDGSGVIADARAARDRRVRVDHLPHRGMVAALNHGLETIESELIARADADDVSLPDRLARQIALLDARPEVGVCGGWTESLPPGTRWTLPEHDEPLRSMLLFGSPFHHPTVMMRREWIARSGCRFDPDFTHAEDYDFWERAARQTRFANLPAVLVHYRLHAAQTTAVHGEAQSARARAVRLRQLRALGITPTAAEMELHEEIVTRTRGLEPARLEAVRIWLERLRDANLVAGLHPEPAFSRVLAQQWYRACAGAAQDGLASAALFARSSLASALPSSPWRYRLRLHALRLVPERLSRRAALWR